MKKAAITTLIAAAVVAASCSEQRPAVVNLPTCEAASGILEVSKIELSDTATVLHFEAWYRPKQWISIAPQAAIRAAGTDSLLHVVSADSIALGEKLIMSESGHARFALRFPPLPKSVTRIDFVECTEPTCFAIYGIRLLPSDAVELAAAPACKGSSELLPAAYDPKPTRISGRVIGLPQGVKATVQLSYEDVATGERPERQADVAPDGTWSDTLALAADATLSVQLLLPWRDDMITGCLVTPGCDIAVTFDIAKLTRLESHLRTDALPDSSAITVCGARFTNEELEPLFRSAQRAMSMRKVAAAATSKTPKELAAYVLALRDSILLSLREQGRTATELSLAEAMLNQRALYPLLHYNEMLQDLTRQSGAKTPYKPVALGADYYAAFVPALLGNLSFRPAGLITDLARASYFALPDAQAAPAARFAYFKQKSAGMLGADSAFILAVVQARCYVAVLNARAFSDGEKQEIAAAFAAQPAFAAALLDYNRRVEQEREALNAAAGIVINEAPNVPGAKLFDAIIAKYRGKPVLVDFWATWCGPCMQAHKAIKPLKDALLAEGDVAIVYITGETSPLKAWQKAIPAISGEHYRLSDAQWSSLGEAYDIASIPTYFVFDRKGKQVLRQAGFPGNDKLREAINKAKR